MAGKIEPQLLIELLHSITDTKDESIVVGPEIGEDAAIIRISNDYLLVIHSDPITGAKENIGWLAIHVAANDIAVRGTKPRWFLPVILLPTNSDKSILENITQQMKRAVKEIDGVIIGGHTEYTVGLDRPIISMTAVGIGLSDNIVITKNARPGDYIIMTKTSGLEGTSILASELSSILSIKGVKEKTLMMAKEYINYISIVKEALLLSNNKLVNSMHDPTEGGILGGLTEMAFSSGTTMYVYEEKVPVSLETQVICKALGIDPYRLISSGVLLATIPKQNLETALTLLKREGIQASVIGEVKKREGPLVYWVKKDLSTEKIYDLVIKDELFRVLEEIYKK